MVRRTQDEDAAAISELDGELFPAICWNENSVRRENKLGWGLVATTDKGKIVGFLMVRLDGRMADIIRVGVSKKYQGKGYGRAMLRRAIEELGDGPMMLTVRKGNEPAKKLYVSEGFTPIAVAGEDALILVRDSE
jgi:ribosomal protein S18 acetylase RimI-like enzyme